MLFGNRIVIPTTKQQEVLEKLNQGHQGIHRCRLRARHSVWWPGLSTKMEQYVYCPQCSRENALVKEPLLPTPLPEFPWQRIATDLFQLGNTIYLIAVDYFSRFPEVVTLPSPTSKSIILALKSMFARHGIPETVISDNGPQYSSAEFQQFAEEYGFLHITSSSHFPQSNGQAEEGVKTIKKFLRISEDPFLSLLPYRAPPSTMVQSVPSRIANGTSNPHQCTYFNYLRFIPKWSYLEKFRQDDSHFQRKQKSDFDKRH